MGPPRKRAREDSSDSNEEQLEVIHPEDVTIVIFCAMAYESVAVKYTLDEEFKCSSKSTGRGTYIYSFGRIKEHNIVIARPVNMGPVNAAQFAATKVTQQFTNVRLALLVGIGAGISIDKIYIRLGDVAISVPRDNHPGVVQYDFGEFESNGNFPLKDCLSTPPRILISRIGALKEDEMMDKMMDKKPLKKLLRRLTKKHMFSRPSHDDILFNPEFPHRAKGSDCSACQFASDVRIALRDSRRTPDQPYVHRGLILLGGGVIKNPKDWDRFRRGYEDTICFEIKAAGILNEILCLLPSPWPLADTVSSHTDIPISPQVCVGMIETPPTVSLSSLSETAFSSNSPGSEELVNSSNEPLPLPDTQEILTEVMEARASWECTQCSERFADRRRLSIHRRKHTLVCPVVDCPRRTEGFSTDRDRNRHLWANHEDYAKQHNTHSEMKRCEVPGCSMICRADNLKRHMKKRHKIKKGRLDRGLQ
ncbi:purine and uridine phosphorylase [Apiospora rasikravindrae]|uniref:Purine and uridine phosphorylase n=1 Tax=Apiospora rasikravindrae TaxID=990691 RepID=A0ABR1SMF0_9PEZI